jgi:hypothetical protein
MANQKQADLLLDLASQECEVWRDTAGVPFATIPVDGARAHVPLRGRGMAAWLRRAFHVETRSAPARDAITAALGVLEGHALYGDAEYETHLRVAQHEGRIYIDIGDATWSAIEVDGEMGWRVIDAARVPIRFRRGSGMQPLIPPVRDGDLQELREIAPLAGDHAYVLAVGWTLCESSSCAEDEGRAFSLLSPLPEHEADHAPDQRRAGDGREPRDGGREEVRGGQMVKAAPSAGLIGCPLPATRFAETTTRSPVAVSIRTTPPVRAPLPPRGTLPST